MNDARYHLLRLIDAIDGRTAVDGVKNLETD